MSLRNHEVEAVVIGGSAGALDVLSIILASLPATLAIPVVVVLHLPPRPSRVHEVLQAVANFPMRSVEDKEPVLPGVVYFAPPGYHLLIERDARFALSMDDPVNYSRPSIDVLFESAGDAYGARLLGILLTGANADGAAGLLRIHRARGLTAVQDPARCFASAMPEAALALFTPTFVLDAPQMGALLATFTPVADRI